MAVNLNDPAQNRNLKDFLLLYNVLTEQCFERCVKRFHSKTLSSGESECANQCTDRYVQFNQKLMFTFVEHQNKKNQATQEAMGGNPSLQTGIVGNQTTGSDVKT